MELWAYYTTSEGGVRNYNMDMFQICRALIPEGVLDLHVVMDKILDWACSGCVNDVAKQLASVEGVKRDQEK